MTLRSYAQELFVIDPTSPASQLPASDGFDEHSGHAHESEHNHEMTMAPIDVEEPVDIAIVVEDIPGAPGSQDPEPAIEVSDEPQIKVDDANEAKSSGKSKNEKWDWEKHGPHGFVAWVKSRLSEVPKHSGQDSAGLERAVAYMERLDNEISKAMRMDLDGEFDANKIEEIRVQLDEGLSRLQARLDKVRKGKKSSQRRKKAEYEIDSDGFIKEAQKITGVSGIVVTVPLLISAIARICVNGMVSASHDLEDSYHRQVEQYSLNKGQQLELRQLLFDMGMFIKVDRGYEPDVEIDMTSSDNYDWQANYKG